MLVKNKTMLIPGFNKAVQIGRTVINFSVKPFTHPRNFGPRPNDGLISNKLKQEEQKELLVNGDFKPKKNEKELNINERELDDYPELNEDQQQFEVNQQMDNQAN